MIRLYNESGLRPFLYILNCISVCILSNICFKPISEFFWRGGDAQEMLKKTWLIVFIAHFWCENEIVFIAAFL